MPRMFSILGKSAALFLLTALAAASAAPGKLDLPDTETFTVAGHPAFIFLPPSCLCECGCFYGKPQVERVSNFMV